MRKYYQAVLLVVAVISLIALFFYRHEYNKLRYVLEVVNYFGKPDKELSNCTVSNIKLEKITLDFDEPFAAWQRLSNDLFVYSSYSKNNKEIVTIGFGKFRETFNLNCNVYVNEGNEVVPGKFSYSVMNDTKGLIENDEYCGFLLKCKFTEEKSPIGVTYYSTTDDIVHEKSFILTSKLLSSEFLNINGYAICVAPFESKMVSLSEITNFLNIHNLLGVNDFILYDYGISVLHNKDLKNTAKYSYTKIPWNFPFSKVRPEIIKEIIEFDCLHRTYSKVMYTTVMSWDERIVLNYHSSLHNLMIDFKKNKMLGHRYMLKSSIMCLQNKDVRFKMNTTTAHKQESIWKNRSVSIFKPNDILDNEFIKTKEILPDLVSVKRYQVCNSVQKNLKTKVSHFRNKFKFEGDV